MEVIDKQCPHVVPQTKDEAWYLMPKAKPYKLNRKRNIYSKILEMLQLARIIQSIHERDKAHRDIKPENILVLNGKYGMLRKQFLKVHRPARYQYLLMTGELTAHLNRVDQEAREQVKIMLKQMTEKQGVTEQMKMQDQMKWVGLMNGIKACAEEIVLKERVYM